MSRCSHYQSHALDHLYGLLDAEESLTLIEHVGQCEDCRAALLKADLHKKLLTAASKPEFAGVRFDVPSEQELQTVRFPSRPAAVRQLNWRRYAAAAAILLAVSAVGIPSSIYLFGQHQANQAYVQAHKELDELARKERQLIKDQDALLVRAGDDYKAAQRALTNLETDQAKALNTAHDAIFKNNMVMVVKGPEAVRLGEETTYVIETRAFDTKAGPGKPVPVKLDAVVRDQTTNRVVFEQKGIASQGVTQLVLAPEVTLKGGSGLALELVAHGADGVRGELTERLALARASYVTHLYTDKPIYQTGETVRWRSLTLDRFTLKPAAEELRLQIKLTGPLGNKILETEHAARIVDTVGREWLGPDKKPLRGIAAGEWQIPTDFSGGDYFLEVKDAVGRFPTERRKFVVNKYQAPRLNKEVKFDKESYGPRGTVTASVKVARAEGGAPVANRDVFAVVQIDGKFYNARGEQVNDEDAAKIRATTDETGAATIRYTLPAEMDKGDATLGLQFNDGANFEAMSRPFNVVVNKLQLEFFPEGGDLIAGVPNRIYFQARTMLDKPATVGKAVLVDETGKVVADNLATLNHPVGKDEPALNQGLNQGMGKFTFTPQAGKKYELKVVEPAGIKAQFALPAVVSDGVALQVPSAVTSEQEPIKIEVRSAGKDRELLVGAYCRGRLLGFHELTAKNGQAASLSIKPAKDVGGVYRVTVFEKLAAGNGRQQLKPVAERLVYRMPAERLNLWVKYPDDHSQRVFAPGTKVNLQLLANSETGSPAPAVVLVGIVDKSVIKMADERTARAMPTHFLLTSEVRRAEDLEFADILLSDHAQATEALDLLLGTQGWRRFLESDPSRMPGKNQPLNAEEMRCNAADVDRLLVALGKSSIDQQRASDTFALRQQQIIDSFGPKFENVQAQLLQTAETLENAREGREFDVQKNGLRDQTDQARAASIAALTKLRQYDDWNATIRSRLLLAFGLILLLAGAGSLLVGIMQNLPRAVPFFGTAVGAVAVCGLLLLGTFVFDTGLPEAMQTASLSDRSTGVAAMTPAEHDRLGDAPPAFGPGGGNGEWGNKRRQQLEEAAKQAGPRPQADEDRKNLNYLREREDRLVDGRGDGKGGQPGQGQKPFVGAAMHDLNRDQQHKGVDPARQEAKGEGGGGGKADPRPGYRAPGLPMPVPPGAAPAPENLAKLAGATAPAMPPGKAGEAGRAVAKDMEQAQRNGRFGGGLNRFKQQPGDLKAADAGLAQAPRGNMPTNGLPPLQEQNLDAVIQNLRAPQYGQNELQARALQNVDALKKLKEAQEKKEVAELDKADKASMAEKSLVRLRQQMEQQQRVLAQPCFVRQYAHERQFGPDPDIRADFTETIYWHPALVLADGKADLGFELPDSVTSFQLVAFGHTADGRLGAFTSEFESKKPFNLNAAVPLEVTANDLIDVPVAVDNNTPDARVIRLTVETHGLTVLPGTENSKTVSLQMKPGERGRTIFRMQPSIKEGTAVVKIKGVTEPFGADAVRYTINVVPEGFPVSSQLSDVLEGVAQHELMLPKDGLIPGTLKANLQVFPSRLADLQGGLEGLLREPRGCFEQTSTSNYPNVMIMGYMRETNQGSQQLFDDAAGKLERGYAKLVSFECMNRGKNQREGYEWFGGTAPAHEALTAYGLLQFRDMKRIGFPVDEAMVARTRKYLLDQRDGEGGFKRNTRALDSFGRAPQEITNAYIVWALTEADLDGNKEDLTKELDALKKLAQDDNQRWSKDPYFLSLVANSFLNRDKSDAFGAELLKKLVTLQKKEGFVDGAQTSITTSGGRTLQIETTGLAVLAWLKYNQPHEFREPLDKAIKWIGQQRGGHGAFGSTQSTILALKALLAYTRENNKPMKAGKLTLKVNGKTVAERDFDANAKEALVIDLPEAEKVFALGKNDVQISLAGGAVLPYTLSWNYSALTPANQEKPAITMSANLSRLSAKDGETVGMTVAVANTQNKGQGMVVAIVGLPAGLELPANLEQLRNYARLQKNDKGEEVNGKISAFEVRGRELVLYWRQMTPNEKIELPIDLICRVPGEYRGPASRSYLYYNADHKYWVDPLKVAVAPKAD